MAEAFPTGTFPILRSSCCIMRVMARPKPPKLTGRFYFPTTPLPELRFTTQEISDLALAVQTWIVGRVARDTAPRGRFPAHGARAAHGGAFDETRRAAEAHGGSPAVVPRLSSRRRDPAPQQSPDNVITYGGEATTRAACANGYAVRVGKDWERAHPHHSSRFHHATVMSVP